MNFPQPLTINGTTMWRVHDLAVYEAKQMGKPLPPEPAPEQEQFIRVKAVAARYNTHPTTVWRWTARSRDGEAA